MLEEYEPARIEIQAAVAADAVWFAPPDRKQFLAEATIVTLSSILLHAFLGAVREAALGKVKQLTTKAFDLMWDAITDLFSDKPHGPAEKALEKAASTAGDTGSTLSPAELDRIMGEVEAQLTTSLARKLRPADAARLAHRVRASVQKTMTRRQAT